LHRRIHKSDDLESFRKRAQSASNQQHQAEQATAAIERARKAAHTDLERWKDAINRAIDQGHTFVFVPRSYYRDSVTVSSIETIFGNPKDQYGWAIASKHVGRNKRSALRPPMAASHNQSIGFGIASKRRNKAIAPLRAALTAGGGAGVTRFRSGSAQSALLLGPTGSLLPMQTGRGLMRVI
jgi:hypothetical protein